MMTDDRRYGTLNFYLERNSLHQRGSYRVATHGLSLYLDDVAQTFDIHDLSSGGCSLHAPAEPFAVGRIFNGDLHIGDTTYLANLKLKVIRHIADSGVACVFQSLSRRQEFMLDKLVLEIQKRNITTHAARKKRKNHSCRNALP
jgi:hypothetical protein